MIKLLTLTENIRKSYKCWQKIFEKVINAGKKKLLTLAEFAVIILYKKI